METKIGLEQQTARGRRCSLGDVAVESRADTATAPRLPPSADACFTCSVPGGYPCLRLKKANIECQDPIQAPRHQGTNRGTDHAGRKRMSVFATRAQEKLHFDQR
ncbi:hypothetical protein CP533_6054 [Ophiocordyceps camponoti-saundersi (nom. inval.)]|nr:hypothetical protein CP533_6054 [Ophiocordyceps camponoti-saundersi (nom. inval.)]